MSRPRWLYGWAAAAACALALAGCGGGDGPEPGPGPSPTRSAADPPAAYLRVGTDQAVAGGVGSHCWKNVCKDSAGVVSNADPVEMPAGGPVAVSYDPVRPTDSEVEWYVAGDPPPKAESFGRAWPNPGTLAPGNAAVTPAKPGKYLLVVFARWAGEGDASYAWYIEVK